MSNEHRIHFPPFALDLVNECLWKGSRAIPLRPKAFAVLELLLSRAGELVSKEQLISAVWHDTFVGDAVLKVSVRQIREALSDDPRSPRFIETAHRRGYRFIGQISARPDAATRPRTTAARVADPPQRRAPDAPAGFVGRDYALAHLHRWMESARGGECQVVFVTGEAGIGKTTLLDTFARSIAGDPAVRICQGQCLEQYGASEAYLPILEAIRELCRVEPRAVDVLRTHAPVWLMLMPSLVTPADREAFAREAAAVTPERMLRVMGEALEVLTAQFTLILVLEDLHWSDFSTLDLLSYLARRSRPAHLMIVGTYRPAELIASRHPLKIVKQELVARRHCEELPLQYLTTDAVAQHVATRFPVNQFPAELAALIHDRTDGNPLFMVNTIDHLVAEGLIVRDGEEWSLSAPLETIKVGVPESIRQLIDTQVDRLDERDQRILEAASVAGSEFSAAAVAAALAADLPDVEARFEELSRQCHFIRECGVQVLPTGHAAGRFGFVHAVYRHVLYDRLSTARRMQLHERVGRRGEEVYGEHAVEIAAELAMHFEQAADFDRAAAYLRAAALNAMHRSAYREAIAASRRGLKLLTALPDTDDRARQELRLQVTLGVPLIATEGYGAREVGDLYRQAWVRCERLDSPPEQSQVLWGLWTFHMLKGEISMAHGLAAEMLRLSERAPRAGVAMRGHWTMEVTNTHQGRFRLALGHFEKGLALCKEGKACGDAFGDALNPGVAIRCFGAWCLWFLGQPDRALACVDEAVTLARQLSEPHGMAHALAFAAVVHQLRREKALARHHAEAAIAIAEEYGLVLYDAMGQIVRGWTLIGTGNDRAAADQIRQGLAGWQRTGARLMLPHFLTLLADAFPPTDRQDEGFRLLEEALALALATGEHMYEAEVHRLRGERLRMIARDEAGIREAEAAFERSLAVARRQEALSLELRAAASLARVRRDGPVPEPAAMVSVYRQFREGFDTADLVEARGLLGLVGQAE